MSPNVDRAIHEHAQFMHNGGIADFPKIKRKLQMSLPDEVFNMVNGNTG